MVLLCRKYAPTMRRNSSSPLKWQLGIERLRFREAYSAVKTNIAVKGIAPANVSSVSRGFLLLAIFL